MEMKPGYRQTEVGVIPDDWEVSKLAAVCSMKSGEGITSASIDQVSKYPCFGGNGLRGFTTRFTHDGRYTLIGRQGALCGNVLGIEGKFFASEHAIVVTASARTDSRWLTFVLREMRLNQYSESSAQPGLSVSKLLSLEVARPPRKADQEAIAEALSDADAFIESLEQLVVKKRQLKQGGMQELLTGKKRLPGFNGEWDVVSLDSVVDRITGVWGANDSSPDHPRCTDIIRAGDISQDGLLTGRAQGFLSEPEFSKAHCRLDDIVITTSGNGLGKVWWSDGGPNVAASNFVRILRPLRGKSQGRYLSYVLRTSAGLKQLQEHTATSAYPNLRPSFFAAAWMSLPPIPEQVAIAAILSDMDAEIAALEAKLTKARSIKQGMMQELLTGRIRLV